MDKKPVAAAEQGEETNKDDLRKAVGAMSRREARELLDALKDDEKSLPLSGFGEQKRRYEEKSYKDW